MTTRSRNLMLSDRTSSQVTSFRWRQNQVLGGGTILRSQSVQDRPLLLQDPRSTALSFPEAPSSLELACPTLRETNLCSEPVQSNGATWRYPCDHISPLPTRWSWEQGDC